MQNKLIHLNGLLIFIGVKIFFFLSIFLFIENVLCTHFSFIFKRFLLMTWLPCCLLCKPQHRFGCSILSKSTKRYHSWLFIIIFGKSWHTLNGHCTLQCWQVIKAAEWVVICVSIEHCYPSRTVCNTYYIHLKFYHRLIDIVSSVQYDCP